MDNFVYLIDQNNLKFNFVIIYELDENKFLNLKSEINATIKPYKMQ